MTSMTVENMRRINEIIDNVDFNRIRKAMIALNWEWNGASEGIPNEYELRREARRLLGQAIEDRFISSVACGGFHVRKFSDGRLSIHFEIEPFEEFDSPGRD